MRVTSVELHPEGSSEVLVLSFRDPRRLNPYNVRLITGLDAEDLVRRYYGGSGNTKFYNISLEKRELGIQVELNPNFRNGDTYSTLRDDVYRMIASSRTGVIEIQFKDGATVVAAISGFVSKMEAPHFEKNQEVRLVVECTDPLLRAPDAVDVDISGFDPASTVVTDSLSTAPHGLDLELSFTAATASLTIGDTDWDFEITPDGGFLAGDVFHVSSEFNAKAVYLTRGANTIHLADKITPGSVWPILFPGDNTFEISTPANVDWVSISHRPAYWGV